MRRRRQLDDDVNHASQHHPGRGRNKRLLARRLIVITIVAAVAVGIYYSIFFTDLYEPILAQVVPIRDFINWTRTDPSRLFGVAAIFILTHVGMYEFLSGREI